MKRELPILLAGLVFSGPAAGAVADTLPPAHVTIHDHTFIPHVIRVKAGQLIIWLNADQDDHTVTSGGDNVDDGRWKSSPPISDGATFMLRLSRPGTYPYFCKPHFYEASMHGVIIVSP